MQQERAQRSALTPLLARTALAMCPAARATVGRPAYLGHLVMAARTPTFAALLLHMLPRERDFPLPAGLCPIAHSHVQQNGRRAFPCISRH